MQTSINDKQAIINSRLPFVIGGLVAISAALLFAMASYQWLPPDVAREFEIRGQQNTQSVRRLPAVRGIIYDRDGVPMAFNALEYEVGISPILVSDPLDVSRRLGLILDRDEYDIYQQINNSSAQWELIARPVPADVGQAILDEDMLGVVINPLSRRAYPQGPLAGPIIGFVIEDNDNTRGAIGVEESYNTQLAGQPLNQTISNIPFDLPDDTRDTNQRGMDVILTIDRDLQYFVESELQRAIEAENASGGTIIVMDPRNGDILAMASAPSFDPNTFIEIEDPAELRNRAIADTYEPGSVVKVLTVAAALSNNVITPGWTYNDQGAIEVGGVTSRNWDRNAYGVVDTTQLLVNSLNVGAVTVARTMGPELFYSSMAEFGLGSPTRVDLPGEEAGILRVPGDNGWNESDLAANSYGQAMSVTPLQMITAFAAVANDGLIYQPRVVRQIINGDEVRDAQNFARRAISSEAANQVTEMMVEVVEQGAPLARIEGYSVAGKTGTAEIPGPAGYEVGNNSTIASFIGFFPADDPQAIVLVKIDRPDNYWGSRSAAPVFHDVAQRLVLLLGIPDDATRLSLQAEGGLVNEED